MAPEQLAELFHETYERLAPAFGWHTKKGCNVKFDVLPQRNKALMIATCQTVLAALAEPAARAAWACGTLDCVCNVKGACDCHNYTVPNKCTLTSPPPDPEQGRKEGGVG